MQVGAEVVAEMQFCREHEWAELNNFDDVKCGGVIKGKIEA
jgi:hypothetical protein